MGWTVCASQFRDYECSGCRGDFILLSEAICGCSWYSSTSTHIKRGELVNCKMHTSLHVQELTPLTRSLSTHKSLSTPPIDHRSGPSTHIFDTHCNAKFAASTPSPLARISHIVGRATHHTSPLPQLRRSCSVAHILQTPDERDCRHIVHISEGSPDSTETQKYPRHFYSSRTCS